MTKIERKELVDQIAAYLRDKCGLYEGQGWLTRPIARRLVAIMEKFMREHP